MSANDVLEGGSHHHNHNHNSKEETYMRGLNPTYFPPLFQLWRGQIALLTTWAQRLDPVMTCAMTMTVGLSGYFLNNNQVNHEAYFAIVLFLYLLSFMEASRYQSFLAVRRRTDAIQSGFFVPVLANFHDTRMQHEVKKDEIGHVVLDIKEETPSLSRTSCKPLCQSQNAKLTVYENPWERLLAHSLVSPYSPISWVHAWTIRYRRVYVFLLTGALLVWCLKLYIMQVTLPGIWILSIFSVHFIFTIIVCASYEDTIHDV